MSNIQVAWFYIFKSKFQIFSEVFMKNFLKVTFLFEKRFLALLGAIPPFSQSIKASSDQKGKKIIPSAISRFLNLQHSGAFYSLKRRFKHTYFTVRSYLSSLSISVEHFSCLEESLVEESSSVCGPTIIERGRGRQKEYKRFLSLCDKCKQLERG